MCMLLKLDYAKFGVSYLLFSKVIEEKPLGAARTPPPGKGRVKKHEKNDAIMHCMKNTNLLAVRNLVSIKYDL